MAAIDMRYARALQAVVADQRLDSGSVLVQLRSLLDAMGSASALRDVLRDPSITEDQKLRVLDALCGKLKIGKTVRNFIALLSKHNRLAELQDMVHSFSLLSDAAESIAEVEVVTALPLDDQSRDVLEAKLSAMTGSNQVHALYSQDPSLLGGIVVRIGSKVYDGSIRAQLAGLKQSLVASAA